METGDKLPQANPELVAELETQYNLGDVMLRKVAEAFASGDYEVAGYASEIYDETRDAAGKIAGEVVSDMHRQESALELGLPLDSSWMTISVERGKRIYDPYSPIITLHPEDKTKLFDSENIIPMHEQNTIKNLGHIIQRRTQPEFYPENN